MFATQPCSDYGSSYAQTTFQTYGGHHCQSTSHQSEYVYGGQLAPRSPGSKRGSSTSARHIDTSEQSLFPKDEQGRIVLPPPGAQRPDTLTTTSSPSPSLSPQTSPHPVAARFDKQTPQRRMTSASPSRIDEVYAEASRSKENIALGDRRRVTSLAQRMKLWDVFSNTKYPSTEQLRRLGEELQWSQDRVRIWFSNERRRMRENGGIVHDSTVGRPAQGSLRARAIHRQTNIKDGNGFI